MSSRPPDPRATITPESFAIAPDLLGLPLARPARRLAAILLDLVPVAIMANAGIMVFLAGLAAVGVWRGAGSLVRGKKGFFLRTAAAIFAFAWVAQLGDGDRGNGGEGDADMSEAAVAAQALQFVPEQYRTPEMEALIEAAGDTAAETTEPLTAAAADSSVLAYAEAIRDGDSAAIAKSKDGAERAIAGPRIGQLQREQAELRDGIRQLREENDRLEQEIEERSQARGIRGFLAGLADDLGIGFGWSALYFTAFLVIGRGQTPGKRALGIRVIRLDGRPIGWWLAFERFGSYFASLTTGLLGFAQIFWDRNRQALHDKVAETVVIRIRHAPPLHVRMR
jgi:hypothetical protein